jgi:hypothetical protein
MRIVEGDRLKHKLTGQLYELKITKEGTFVLESEEIPYRMWFGERDLKLFFERARKKREDKKVIQYSAFDQRRQGQKWPCLFSYFTAGVR